MRILLIVLALSSAARADAESALAEARQRYQRGTRLYDLNDWQAALAEFEQGYRVKSDAAFLFNVAQCNRKLGRYEEAAQAYRAFLRAASKLDEMQRRQIESLAAAMEESLPQQPLELSPPQLEEIARETVAPAPPPAPREVPTHKKWWVWTTVAVVTLVVGVSIGVGVGVGLSHESTPPRRVHELGTFRF